MRAIRVAVAGVAAVAATLAIPPSLAHAAPAAAPAAPYDVFTVDGTGNSGLSPEGQSYTVDDSNGTFSLTRTATSGVDFSADLGLTHFSVLIEPQTGGALSVGTYQTATSADASHVGMNVGVGGHGCDQSAGTLNVTEYGVDDSGAVTAFAATYSANCDGESRPVYGEIRWHSTKDYVAATQAPATGALAFGNVDLGQTGTKTVTVTATGSQPIHFQTASVGGRDASNFTIAVDNCSNATLSYGQTCAVSVTAHPTTPGAFHTDLVIPDDTASGGRAIPVSATGVVGAAGTYYPVDPARILDTRSGNGAPTGQVGAGGVVHLQVTGRGGVPASGVSAVVLNVTVTGATAASYLTVWPEGGSRPLVSNIDFPAGWTGANSTTVPVGTGGKVDIFNFSGKVSIIADVVGYYAKDDTVLASQGLGGQYLPYDEPWRWYDSRAAGADGPLVGGSWEIIWLNFDDPSFNAHVRAASVNITAVNPTQTGFFTAWNGQGAPPTGTSTLNFTKGKTVPNMTVVPTAPCTADISPDCVGDPMIAVYNSSGSTDVIVDLFGLYDDGTVPGGLRFRAVNPVRITDSRIGQGLPGALGAGATGTVTVPNSILNNDTESLALNVTGVAPTADTYLTLWPTGESRPPTSNLDPAKGSTVANTANILLWGANYNQFSVYNHSGTANVLVDVQGAFDYYPYTPDGQANLKAATAAPSRSPSAGAHFLRH